MLDGERPARCPPRIHRLFRGLELICDAEHLIKNNRLDYFIDEAPCDVENRWPAGSSFNGICEWSVAAHWDRHYLPQAPIPPIFAPRRRVAPGSFKNSYEPEMIGPSSQQKVDPLHTAAAETQRLISVQDELTIAGLCKGIDTTESENKSRDLRVVLEGMKALGRRRAGGKR
jgi:hypothetical protein